ncbi:MAG: hypothetical protein ACR2Q4_13885 [Geminicoccaceae bacterium]
MKPVRRDRSNPDLFREWLDAIIDMRQGLAHVAEMVQPHGSASLLPFTQKC